MQYSAVQNSIVQCKGEQDEENVDKQYQDRNLICLEERGTKTFKTLEKRQEEIEKKKEKQIAADLNPNSTDSLTHYLTSD